MSWNSLMFLMSHYWPYLTAVAVIGIVVGWRSFTPPKA
jgi:hypothetical protein